jgi:hypothetical protein
MNYCRKIFQRWTAVLTAIIMIFLTFSLCSCAPKTKDVKFVSGNVYTNVQTYPSDMLLVELQSSVEDTVAGTNVITVYAEEEGYVVLWGNEKTGYLSKLTSDYKVVETFPLEGIVSGTGLWILESDNDWIIISSEIDELWHMQYYATTITISGEVVAPSVCIEQLCDRAVLGVELVGNTLTVVADNAIFVFDKDYTYEKSIQYQGIIMDVALASNGQLYAAINKENQEQNDIYLAEIDVEAGKVNITIKMSEMENAQAVTLFGSSSGFVDSLCLSTTAGVFIYSFSDSTMSQKVVISAGQIGMQKAFEIFRTKENQMFIWGEYCITSASTETKMLINVETLLEAPQKEVLTLGILNIDDANTIRVICEYVNAQALPYSIEIVSYVNQDDLEKDFDSAMENGRKRLLLDILSEKTPDILCVSLTDMMMLEDQSALISLDPYIGASERVNENDFLDEIWDASAVDGSHYWAIPFVSICGIAATESNAEIIGNGSVEEIRSIAESSSAPLCQYGNNLKFFYPTIQSQYIDFLQQEVSINSDAFLSLLSLITDINAENISFLATGMEEPILWSSRLGSFRSYIELSQARSEPVTVIGYPEMVENGPTIDTDASFAISAQSGHIKEAWQFLEFILSEEVQNMYASLGNGNIPINKSAFEDMIINDANEYERQILKGEAFHTTISTYTGNGANISIGTPKYPINVDEAMMDRYRDIVSCAVIYYSDNTNIRQIVSEELEFCFHGDKTPSEVARVLDSRLSILISE